MANDKSRDRYQGLLVMDPRLSEPGSTLWPAESSYAQASPTAGVPAAQGDYELVVHSTGTQTAARTLEVKAHRAGHPSRLQRGGGFVWKNSADAATGYRGWEGPQIISGWEPVVWNIGAEQMVHPDAVTLENGKIVVVCEHTDSVGGHTDILCHVRGTDGTWAAATTILTETYTDANPANPCIMIAGDRLFCFHWLMHYTGITFAIRAHVSLDDGATWSVANDWASVEQIKSSAAYSVASTTYAKSSTTGGGRLRARHLNGQTLVVAHVKREGLTANHGGVDVLRQYAATDLGMNLIEIDTGTGDDIDGDTGGGWHDIAVVGGQFVVGYVTYDDARNSVRFSSRRIGSAFIPLTTMDPIDAATGSWGDDLGATTTRYQGGNTKTDIIESDFAMCVDDAGVLWAFTRKADTGTTTDDDQCCVAYSDDGGASWNRWGRDPLAFTDVDKAGNWWHTGDTGSSHPTNYCATFQRGRVVLLTNGNADGWSQASGNLSALFLGGYHNLGMPWVDLGDRADARGCFELTAIPVEAAVDMSNRTHTNDGTYYTNGMNPGGYVKITTGDGAGNNGWSYATWAEGPIAWPNSMHVHFAMHCTAGGDTATEACAVQLRLDEGSAGTSEVVVTIRIDSTGFIVYDSVAAAVLRTVSGLPDEAREWRIGVRASDSAKRVAVFYRAWGGGDEDKEWIAVGRDVLATQASTAGNDWCRHGHITAAGSVTQVVSRWYMEPSITTGNWQAADSNAGSFGLWADWVIGDNPLTLPARAYAPTFVYVDDGVSIRASDGPAIKGDEHVISTRYLYAIERTFSSVHRSPRVGWRSVDTATQANIALEYDSALTTQESEHGRTLMGLCLMEINWRTGKIQRYDQGTTAWVDVVTIDTALDSTTLDFTRTGTTVQVGTANVGTAYIHEHELAGAVFDLNGTHRRIAGNTEGKLDGNYTGRIARLRLTDPATGDPTSGTNTGRILPKDVCILFHSNETSRGWRLVIDSQTTVDGDFRIGQMMLGPVHTFGYQYAWGRIVEMEPGYQLNTTADGQTHASNTAPSRRTAQIAWTDGIDLSNVEGSAPDPDYIETTTTAAMEPAGAKHGTPYELHGLLDREQGNPMVYLPRIPKSAGGAADTIYLNRRHQFLYCSARSPVRIETIQGDEGIDEVVRVAGISLAEEI